MWNREEIIWAAGLFEGEGSITKHFKKIDGVLQGRPSWRLSVWMTDEDVVRKFHRIIKRGSIRLVTVTKLSSGLSKKPQWAWTVQARGDVYAILTALYPFLGSRRQARALEAMAELPPAAGRHCRAA